MALKVIIDPGHGGADPGAVGNDIQEKNLTLAISKTMYDEFKRLGIPVYLTRDNDATLTPNERINKIKSFINSGDDVVIISNHINAGGGEGAEVIYALRNNEKLSQKILNSLASSGQIIRKYYQKRSTSNANKDYYFMLRDTSPYEAVIVEYGFLDNVKDANKLKNNYKEYALDVVDAVLNYKGIIPDNIEFYIVKKGDTLYSIAKKYGMSVDKLMSINNLNNTNLSIGQTLLVKEKNIDKTPNIISSNVYIVQAGDTLYSIAKKYNTTVDKLKDLNNLASNLISVNQKLLLPSNNYYIVQAGDTLYSIAKKNNTTVDKIKEINKLNSNLISINQKLLLP